MAQDTTRTVKKLFVFAIVMFGFGYVMVPIYEYTFFRVPDSNDVIVSDKKSVKAINTKDW